MPNWTIGQRVLVKAMVRFAYGSYPDEQLVYRPDPYLTDFVGRDRKSMYRKPFWGSVEGIFLGYTHRSTGYGGGDLDGEGWLKADKLHKVYVVRLHLADPRWRKPVLVLEEDLESEKEANVYPEPMP